MKDWFDENGDRIDWDHFDDWVDDVEDEPGYDWLQGVFRMWEQDEAHDIPQEWIRSDGTIQFRKIAQYIQQMVRSGEEIDADEMSEWFDDHEDMIRGDDFDNWFMRVKDLDGYEWVNEMSFTRGDVPEEWINDDGMIEWSYASDFIDEQM